MDHGFNVVGNYPCGEEVEKSFNTLKEAQSFTKNLIVIGGSAVIYDEEEDEYPVF